MAASLGMDPSMVRQQAAAMKNMSKEDLQRQIAAVRAGLSHRSAARGLTR